jgi:hypothetical protein
MMGAGDPAVLARLEQVRLLYADAGAIEYVQDVVREAWRVNRRRWAPEKHFDDKNTLGYLTSRNVNNCIYQTIETSGVSPSVVPETEPGVVILGLGGFRLRVVKAPIESGLKPDFENDFDWSPSATRVSAARRNSNNYYPFAADEWTLDFEGDPRPRHLRQVEVCRELFLVWAAELTSDRTAGWLGLPQLGDWPWMGVIELWFDEATEEQVGATDNDDVADEEEEEDD